MLSHVPFIIILVSTPHIACGAVIGKLPKMYCLNVTLKVTFEVESLQQYKERQRLVADHISPLFAFRFRHQLKLLIARSTLTAPQVSQTKALSFV